MVEPGRPAEANGLTGRVCAVTGGTRGIGAELARRMAESGAAVAVCGRDAGSAERAARDLAAQTGSATFGAACDVSDAAAVDGWVQEIVARFGRLDVAIANAAVLGPVGLLENAAMAEWADTVAIDLGGVANVARAVVPHMRSNGFGRVVALSGGGVGGPRPLVRASAYVASKAAVCALVEVLGLELDGTGVTVNAVAPGAVPTGFMDAAVQAGPAVAGEAMYAAASSTAPTDLGDLCELVTWLVSDRAGWVSGRILSARWDSVASLEGDREAIEDGSRLRMRRIDDDLFHEAGPVAP